MSNGKALEARQFASSTLGVPIRDLALTDTEEDLVTLQEVSRKRRFISVTFKNGRPVHADWGRP